MAVTVHLVDGTVLEFPDATTVIKASQEVYVIGVGPVNSVNVPHGLVAGDKFAWAVVDAKGTEVK